MTVIAFANDFPAQPPERPLEYPDSDVDEAIHTLMASVSDAEGLHTLMLLLLEWYVCYFLCVNRN